MIFESQGKRPWVNWHDDSEEFADEYKEWETNQLFSVFMVHCQKLCKKNKEDDDEDEDEDDDEDEDEDEEEDEDEGDEMRRRMIRRRRRMRRSANRKTRSLFTAITLFFRLYLVKRDETNDNLLRSYVEYSKISREELEDLLAKDESKVSKTIKTKFFAILEPPTPLEGCSCVCSCKFQRQPVFASRYYKMYNKLSRSRTITETESDFTTVLHFEVLYQNFTKITECEDGNVFLHFNERMATPRIKYAKR